MSGRIIDGKAVAAGVRAEVAAAVKTLPEQPALAVVLVGGDPASQVYVTSKGKATVEAGMRSIDGVLRVAHSSSVDTLAIVLDRYAQRHPDVRIEERVLACDAQLAALRKREIDVAVCRLAGEPSGDCRVELLRLDPILAALAPQSGVAPLSLDPACMPTYVGDSGGEWPARDGLIASFERAAGCVHQLRPYQRGQADRPADRRPPVRRSRRPAPVALVRGGTGATKAMAGAAKMTADRRGPW